MTLSAGEQATLAWRKTVEYVQQRVQELDVQNRADLPGDRTARVRGEIAGLLRLVSILTSTPAGADDNDETEQW